MVHVLAGVLRREQIVEGEDAEEGKRGRGEHDVEDELEEELHVALADAVVDPRAVVVHLEYAEAALAAVVRPRRFPRLAPRALLAILHLHEFALERRCHTIWDAAGVGEGRPQVRGVRKEAEAVEDEEVKEALARERDPLDELLLYERLSVPVENVCTVPDVLAVHDQQQSLHDEKFLLITSSVAQGVFAISLTK